MAWRSRATRREVWLELVETLLDEVEDASVDVGAFVVEMPVVVAVPLPILVVV